MGAVRLPKGVWKEIFAVAEGAQRQACAIFVPALVVAPGAAPVRAGTGRRRILGGAVNVSFEVFVSVLEEKRSASSGPNGPPASRPS